MSKYKIAEVKFNGGKGTVLCNLCSVMLTDACDTSSQIDCYHICEDCYSCMNANTLQKLLAFAHGAANTPYPFRDPLQGSGIVIEAQMLLNELGFKR